MKTKLEAIQVLKLTDKILDIIENKDDLTHSDLQGRIMAVIMNAMTLGKQSK